MDESSVNTTNRWQSRLQSLAIRCLGEQAGRQLWQRYQGQFQADYQSLVPPRYGLKDILQLERLTQSNPEAISLLKPTSNQSYYRLHFYSLQDRYLDEFIPVLENMHLRVMDQVQFSFAHPYPGGKASIKSFTIKTAKDQGAPLSRLKSSLVETLQAVMTGQVENDALNRLVVLTGMTWQEIEVLRTYRNYYLQIGHRTTAASFHRALINNPSVAIGLFNYFEARFKPDPAWIDPVMREEQALFPVRMQLLADIDRVEDINDDRILRTVFNLIDATVRSNFHLRRVKDDFFIAIKINSLGVIDMPAPRPYCEIYVHAKEMEGLHLRGGKVARGGIRWSDRADDFRTEILGLMQTQVNKNALIIPTGAKGGFVVKNNGGRADSQEAGKQAYLKLIRGMLDLTGNFRDGAAVNPEGVVAHDDPDPYLVVAADKGTAKFSDIANGVSADYCFWLGDAFASGGSRGYDHKALGITARGAWECVKRHFRELGKDIQQEPFTVIGVGSMDGDVFGNGMLLSPYIRLQAAFSGQHIFIDPNPQDSTAAFTERQRLFELPGSSWDDYDRTLISSGGGVYSRTAKDIPVSPVLKQWLGIRYQAIDGESLIRYLLTASVELLWLGGIGTYVKASMEKHDEAGDRSNDAVRVDAIDLKAKVVGEGANLGFTQKARIEYSLLGGRINTDAVDNSAGVDTSDHEVNLKILLTGLHKKRLIDDYQTLFIAMTEAVCQLVLADNVAQSLCLSLDQLRCAGDPAMFMQVADRLEVAGYLDRTVESFAQNKDIKARPGQCLSRPELADLMAASKMYLSQQLLSQRLLLQKPYYDRYLEQYFPGQIIAQFKENLAEHPLAGEIKATVISNTIINQAGCGFLGLNEITGNGSLLPFVNCYLAFDRILQADVVRTEVMSASHQLPVTRQYQFLTKLEHTLAEFCCWSVRYDRAIYPDHGTIKRYRAYLEDYELYCVQSQPELGQLSTAQHQQNDSSLPIAQKLALLDQLQDFPFVVALVSDTGTAISTLLDILNEIDRLFGIKQIRQQLTGTPVRDHWEKQIIVNLLDDLQQFLGQMVKNTLASRMSWTGYFERYNGAPVMKDYQALQREVQNTQSSGLLPYVLLIRALGKTAEE